MKKIATLCVLMLFLAVSLQAGIQWTAKIVTEDQKGKTTEMMTVTSAQDGNFRQEFSNVSKRQRDQYVEDGYWLYKGKEGMLYIVNHKEKTVTPMSLEALQQVLQALGPIVRMELEDVDVKGLVTVHGPVASEVVMTPSAVGLAGLHGAGSGTLLALVALGAVVVWLRRR